MTVRGEGLSERRQQQLLRSYGTHTLDAIFTDPDAGVSEARAGMWGSSHHRMHDGSVMRLQTGPDGIGFGGDWSEPEELLTWSQVKKLARSIPEDLRQEILDLRRRWNKHQSIYPRFTASAAAAGCGPFPRSGPLTERQAKYAEELEAWEASGVLPSWEAKKAVIEQERSRLHDRALPLAASDEPVDLLELLAQTPAPTQRPAIAPPPPSPRPASEREAPTEQLSIGVGSER
jgi:hypothetical protein